MVISFLITPLITALILLFMIEPSFKSRRGIALTSCILQLILSLVISIKCLNGEIFVLMMGGWAAPYGIALVVDFFSALMLFATLLVYLTTILYGAFEIVEAPEPYFRLPLIFFLQAGTNLILITGDFFNLFVAFEIMLTSSYALLSLEAQKGKVKQIFSYVSINLAGSMIFLWGAAMAYGYTGNLNMAALALFFADKAQSPLTIAFALLMLSVVGLKIGIFPLYFWLPESYPILPYSINALFGGILGKVGIYVLLRLFLTVLPHDLPTVKEWMILLSIPTMLLGVIGAISKTSIKEILSYHIISQVGYIVFAIGVFTPLSLAAALLFTLHNMWVKTSLFLYAGIAGQYFRTDSLNHMGGGLKALPWVGALFLLQALSLAGLPPLSGFWGKYLILSEGLSSGHTFAVVIALLTSWMTLFSMLKIWGFAFWGEEKPLFKGESSPLFKYASLAGIALVVFSLLLGFGVEYALQFSENAITHLLDKQNYIHQVFGFSDIAKLEIL
ncbi:Na(+)/H(+) antiporter subunit D [Chlamydiales bacterium STE3]|nr:Na(+)/H(+) antiporter subunit D [Chlamydiales bacterium STE3]